MNTPPVFLNDNLPALYGHIEAHGFATLVTFGKDGLTASDRQDSRDVAAIMTALEGDQEHTP